MRNIVLQIIVCFLALAPVLADAAPRDDRGANRHAPIKVLPKANKRIVHKGSSYYYSAGRYYKPNKGAYVQITAPIGLVIPALPYGFITIGVGSNRYYHHADVYYQRSPNGYVVIEKPVDAPEGVSSIEQSRLIVYPANGQDEEQRGRDKYECHVWASNETSFDPTLSGAGEGQKSEYQRAMGACLEARSYVIK